DAATRPAATVGPIRAVHGTTPAAAQQILREGFRAGGDRNALGAGVYLCRSADDASLWAARAVVLDRDDGEGVDEGVRDAVEFEGSGLGDAAVQAVPPRSELRLVLRTGHAPRDRPVEAAESAQVLVEHPWVRDVPGIVGEPGHRL